MRTLAFSDLHHARARAEVLVTDRTSGGMSVGSVAIRAANERVQPCLALCGHIHDCWGEEGQIGATWAVNPGPTPNWFEV